MYSLLTFGGHYIEEWVRVFYASIWIDPNYQWMRVHFDHKDVSIHTAHIREMFSGRYVEEWVRVFMLLHG
jgi:hypothetical protein